MPALQPAPLEHNIPDGKCLFRDLSPFVFPSHRYITIAARRAAEGPLIAPGETNAVPQMSI